VLDKFQFQAEFARNWSSFYI